MGNPFLDNKQFFETDYQEAQTHKSWLDSLIVTLTHGEETKPAEGFAQAVVEFEDPAIARARVAVALGLIPIDTALSEGILEKAVVGRRVDSLALRMRQRLYPDAYNITFAQHRVVAGLTAEETTKLPSSLSGVGQETIITPDPNTPAVVDGDPLFDQLNKGHEEGLKASREAAGGDPDPLDEKPAPKGKLPPDFPAFAALDAAGFGSYGKLRKKIASGTEESPWYADVKGVGAPTAEKIEEAVKARPIEEDEE